MTSGSFWNGLSFSDDYMRSTAERTLVEGREVLIVHPAILLVQKLSNKGNLPPREKDLRDVRLLINKFSSLSEANKSYWRSIIEFSLGSFRNEMAEKIAGERIRECLF